MMDPFAAIVLIGLVVCVGALLLLARMGHRTSDITDRKARERWGVQAQIEERDVGQMIDGQNQLRRSHGECELTEADIRREVGAQERGRFERAENEQRPGVSATPADT